MVTKGIIEQVISPYKFRVRIPVYNKAKSSPTSTPTDELAIAITCSPAGVISNFKVGDVVIVGFEDNMIGKPVILGYLNNGKADSLPDINALSLNIVTEAKLPYNTMIGSVTPSELAMLSGIKNNVQWQIELLNSKVDKIVGDSAVPLTDEELQELLDILS